MVHLVCVTEKAQQQKMLTVLLTVTLLPLAVICSPFLDSSVNHPTPPLYKGVVISNCSADPVNCQTCNASQTIRVEGHKCIPLPAMNGIIAAPYARFECLEKPFLCTPTQAFWNDPNCTHPMETLWTPCGGCIQSPPRLMECAVLNNSYHSLVTSCGNDAMCKKCEPFDGTGLKAGVCWPHPGVPGLFLKFSNLEPCGAIRVIGYQNSTCKEEERVAETLMPSQHKCFQGIKFECEAE